MIEACWWGVRLAVACVLMLIGAAHAASLPPVESTSGLVVSAQHLAAEAGVDILRRGGNAIDAAVAVGYAEAVVNPCCGNIGGGGFLTAHLADGRDIFINFRETAPAAASREDRKSTRLNSSHCITSRMPSSA